jgi:hypothetical protein
MCGKPMNIFICNIHLNVDDVLLLKHWLFQIPYVQLHTDTFCQYIYRT